MLLDILFCITGLFFLLCALFRGFVRESFSIGSLLVAYFLAYHYGSFLTAWLEFPAFLTPHASAVSHSICFFLLLWLLRLVSVYSIQKIPHIPVWLRFSGIPLGVGMAAFKTLLVFCILLAALQTYPASAGIRTLEDGSRTALYLKNTAQVLPLLASGDINETNEVLYDQFRYYKKFLFRDPAGSEHFSQGILF